MDLRYVKKTSTTDEHILYAADTPNGKAVVHINVEKLLIGFKCFVCEDTQDYTLNPAELLAALELVRSERGKIRDGGGVKTLTGWSESGFDSFDDYVAPGDEVDNAMVDYFTDILPPRSLTGSYLQVGEPHSHEPDETGRFRATWATFVRRGGRWFFVGCCFTGELEPRVSPETGLERKIKRARTALSKAEGGTAEL